MSHNMEKEVRSFEDLECWKICTEVRRDLMLVLKKYPAEEKFSLTDNTKRASRSITQNIAEGYGRYHYYDKSKFCVMSRGSLYELIDQMITANDEKYITEEEYKTVRSKIEKAIIVLNGYINYLDKKGNEELEKKKKGKV